MRVFTHYTNIDFILNDEEFNQSLEESLNYFESIQPPCPTQNGGKAITTCSNNAIVFNLKKSFLIKYWLENTLREYFRTLNITDYQYGVNRAWCNRIFYGCTGTPHRHLDAPNSLSLVLYYQIPENSSKFILIDTDIELPSYKDYDPYQLSFLDVKSGLGICHPGSYYHAVSEHKSEQPRTCFVFDIEYVV